MKPEAILFIITYVTLTYILYYTLLGYANVGEESTIGILLLFPAMISALWICNQLAYINTKERGDDGQD